MTDEIVLAQDRLEHMAQAAGDVLEGVLKNWQQADLRRGPPASIVVYASRDGRFSEAKVAPQEFIQWLSSDRPFDPVECGANADNAEWLADIDRLCRVAGLNSPTCSISVMHLHGRLLDWAVAKALGYELRVKTWREFTDALDPREFADVIQLHRTRGTVRVSYVDGAGSVLPCPAFSSDRDLGWPIVEREIDEVHMGLYVRDGDYKCRSVSYRNGPAFVGHGATPLIAGLRCLVLRELGERVEVPRTLFRWVSASSGEVSDLESGVVGQVCRDRPRS